MRKIVFTLLVALLSLSLYSEQKTIELISYQKINKDGSMFTGVIEDGLDRFYYVNGKPHGRWLKFYASGRLKSIEDWKDGLLDGKFILYSEDEVKLVENHYSKGNDHGVYTLYYSNGKPHIKGSFNNGSQSGVWEFYDEKGNLVGKSDFNK